MATPSPINATKNSTSMLTLVTCSRPLMSRNVDGMAVIAISSGTNASKLPKTNANTASAPSPPSIASTITLVPLPELLPAASWLNPVTPTCQPAGAACAAADRIAGVLVSAPNPVLGGGNSSANEVRPSLVAKCASPVVTASASRTPGTAAAAAVNTRCATAGLPCEPVGAVSVTTVGCCPPPLW